MKFEFKQLKSEFGTKKNLTSLDCIVSMMMTETVRCASSLDNTAVCTSQEPLPTRNKPFFVN